MPVQTWNGIVYDILDERHILFGRWLPSHTQYSISRRDADIGRLKFRGRQRAACLQSNNCHKHHKSHAAGASY